MTPRAVLLAVALLLPGFAVANEPPPFYVGFTLGAYDFDDGDGTEDEVTNMGLRGGFRFNKWLAIEGQAGRSTGGTSTTVLDGDVNYGGVFGRFDLPYPDLNIYFLLGGSAVHYEDVDGNTHTESGAAGGIGIELFGAPQTSVTLDYMVHADDYYHGVSLGLTHYFNWPRFR